MVYQPGLGELCGQRSVVAVGWEMGRIFVAIQPFNIRSRMGVPYTGGYTVACISCEPECSHLVAMSHGDQCSRTQYCFCEFHRDCGTRQSPGGLCARRSCRKIPI